MATADAGSVGNPSNAISLWSECGQMSAREQGQAGGRVARFTPGEDEEHGVIVSPEAFLKT